MKHVFKSRSTQRVLVLACLTGGSLLGASTGRADSGDIGTLFQVNDADPLQNIPTQEERNAHPLEFGYYLQDLIARAQVAYTKKDWARAAKYFEVIGRIVPDQAITFSRLCMCYGELGRVDVAAANCGRAVRLPGALVYDHLHFIKLTLKKEKFTQADAADIEASLAHLRAQKPELLIPAPVVSTSAAPSSAPASPATASAAAKASAAPAPPAASAAAAASPAHPVSFEEYQRQLHKGRTELEKAAVPPAPPANLPLEVETLSCQLAVRLEDVKRLSACVDGLKRVHADPRLVVSFEWSQALVSHDHERADAILDQAKALKMPASALRAMEAEQDRYLKPAGILGFLTHGASGRMTAIVATLLAFAGTLVWLFAGGRRRKAPVETQAS